MAKQFLPHESAGHIVERIECADRFHNERIITKSDWRVYQIASERTCREIGYSYYLAIKMAHGSFRLEDVAFLSRCCSLIHKPSLIACEFESVPTEKGISTTVRHEDYLLLEGILQAFERGWKKELIIDWLTAHLNFRTVFSDVHSIIRARVEKYVPSHIWARHQDTSQESIWPERFGEKKRTKEKENECQNGQGIRE